VKAFLRLVLVLLLLGAGAAMAWVLRFSSRLDRVPESPAAGFRSPYFLYLPRSMEASKGGLRLLVQPNNTGSPDDDEAVHRRKALLRTYSGRELAEDLGTPLLVPCFPRPRSKWRVYTHALDRDTFLDSDPELARLDLQLLAMIEDARGRISTQTGREVDRRVLISGFSANGMFANRFAILHPDRVLAAACGSPGGWPLAPVSQSAGKSLRFPIGMADASELRGAPIDAAALRDLRILVYQGDADLNDSVAFDDGWDPEDRALVNELFGSNPRERFEAARGIYSRELPRSELVLLPGVGHTRTPEMNAAVARFFASALAARR